MGHSGLLGVVGNMIKTAHTAPTTQSSQQSSNVILTGSYCITLPNNYECTHMRTRRSYPANLLVRSLLLHCRAAQAVPALRRAVLALAPARLDARAIIATAPVQCSASRGCTGQLGALDAHWVQCPLAPVPCHASLTRAPRPPICWVFHMRSRYIGRKWEKVKDSW